MMASGDVITHRHVRAPRDHGAVLVDPPWNSAADLLVLNRVRRHDSLDLHGYRLGALIQAARCELLDLAWAYTHSYLDAEPPRPETGQLETLAPRSRPIVMTGHQPQLYHPGVWFKNFALSALGKRHDALAINLLIDNDNLRTVSIKVPTGSAQAPHAENVPYDQPAEEIPFEERTLRDASVFHTFGERGAALLKPLVAAPLLTDWWPDVCAQSRREPNLGRCLAAARHRLERAWGLETLELPLSAVCETSSFRWFAAHLLCELPRLRDLYNGALAEYRRVHHLRGKSHPVPELARDEDWLEAPFWIWTASAPRRRRAFARQYGGHLEITDRGDQRVVLETPPDGDLARAVDQLAAWSRAGVRFRPRALMTTLYARLVLSDLFVHGIGGAKYDQLTYALLRRFFACAPPAFLTLTATAHLPIAHDVVTESDVRAAHHMLRDLWFHPERHLAAAGAPSNTTSTARQSPEANSALVRELIAAKRRWLADNAPRGQRRQRHRALSTLNESLRHWVAPLRNYWIAQREAREAAHKSHALLASREFAFCLFPAEELRRLLLELSAVAP